jgi:hypothetical protein
MLLVIIFPCNAGTLFSAQAFNCRFGPERTAYNGIGYGCGNLKDAFDHPVLPQDRI